jgi:hypothetical protein
MKVKPPARLLRFAPILVAAALLAGPAEAELRCNAIPNLMRGYLQNHVRFNQLTEEIERRATETYVRR